MHLEALLLLVGRKHERALLGLRALALLRTPLRALLFARVCSGLAMCQGSSHKISVRLQNSARTLNQEITKNCKGCGSALHVVKHIRWQYLKHSKPLT